MNFNIGIYKKTRLKLPLCLAMIFSLTLLGCGSDSDDSDSSTSYIQLYNISSNAPGIYLTRDKYSDDDYDEKIYSAITFTNISSRLEVDSDTYDIELAWQDEYNNSYDLEIIYENSLTVNASTVEFIVIAEDIKSPTVLVYDIPVRGDEELEDDSDDDVFNLRLLNMHTWSEGVDVYYSESGESFNEAELLAKTTYTQMADNQKIAEDSYIFYITSAGSDEVLFQSQEISFPYASEYIMVVRENTGAGSSPFLLDILSTSSATEFSDVNSEASYRVYNGIIEHELLPIYQSMFDFHINGIDDSAEISSLAFGEFSQTILTESNDYSMGLVTSSEHEVLINNHLLALGENSNQTIFFYLLEEAVDEDGDGDIDEDGDGYIDETKISINSLVVDNSQSDGIYSHQINVINLIDEDEINDDFTYIKVYFVQSDETIETAEQLLTATFATPNAVELTNNTYDVYAVGRVNSSDIILSAMEITLDEDSNDLFMVLERDISAATGYKMVFTDQTSE